MIYIGTPSWYEYKKWWLFMDTYGTESYDVTTIHGVYNKLSYDTRNAGYKFIQARNTVKLFYIVNGGAP